MVNKGGRPRINPKGVTVVVRSRVPEDDVEFLKGLGYNTGAAIREFAALKRRTMLPLMSKEEAEELLKREEKIQRESKSREQDLLNELAIVNKIKAENESVKGDLKACKELTVQRLEENKELFLTHGDGYKEILERSLSAMTEETLTVEDALEFFEAYRKTRSRKPKIYDIESLVYS